MSTCPHGWWSRREHRAHRARAAGHAYGRGGPGAGLLRELLGLPEIPKPPHLARRGGCWFESATAKVHLGVEQDFRPAKKAHPALLVRDLPDLVARLREAGVELIDDEPLAGYDRVYASDPFGNRVELMEPSSDGA